jgi:hypothetical protein
MSNNGPQEVTLTVAFAWLIERGPVPEWFVGYAPEDRDGWSRDPNSACRFARREDAGLVLGWLRGSFKIEGLRATEHEWIDNEPVEIIVNTRKRLTREAFVTYDDALRFAGICPRCGQTESHPYDCGSSGHVPAVIRAVVWSLPRRNVCGSLAPGEKTPTVAGMLFSVHDTSGA